MVKFVPDKTGRFSRRPHYEPRELDRECESIITRFLTDRYGAVNFPVLTEDLTRLIERDAEDLDLYADLTPWGADVEGLTEFQLGRKPRVKISAKLSENERMENRLRTTLCHEYGHVHFHAYLWEAEPPQIDLLKRNPDANRQICKRDGILNSSQVDWMEWQAGYVCGALLMPASRMRLVAGAYMEQNGLYGSVSADGPHSPGLIDIVQKNFQVSGDAARVRLFKLGILGNSDPGPSLFNR